VVWEHSIKWIENIKIIEDAYPNSLTELELTTIHKVKEKYNELMKVPCTGCGYCMPCPNKVDIPGNFALYNDAFMYNTLEKSISEYHQMKERKELPLV
jgi:predicted aldo/keto reductase-like oxidoreductase